MKKLLTLFAMLFTIVFLTMQALADSPDSFDIVVQGTMDPATDIANVQDAVDNYEKVLLVGAFNFGYDGIDFTVYPPEIPAVYIEKDVQIFGVTDNKGEPLTRISGGFWPFFTPIPIGAFFGALVADGPKITIQNIHFDGAMFAALNFSHTSGLMIANNKITNVIPIGPSEIFERPGSYWQGGAYISTVFVDPRNNIPGLEPAVVPGAITGPLVFNDNEVDLEIYYPPPFPQRSPEDTMGQGVYFVWTWGAIIEVKGNTFKNVTRNSIELLDNYKAESGIITVSNNEVIMDEFGIDVPSPSTPNGIVIGWFNDPEGATDPEKYSEIFIEHNYVEMQGDPSKPYPETGIILLSDGGTISKNHIVMGGAGGAAGIYQSGSNGLISNNRINGSGYCAMWATSSLFMPSGGNNNTFNGNNINNFNPYPWGYDVIFMGDYNVLNGGSGTVWNLGDNNVINGGFIIAP